VVNHNKKLITIAISLSLVLTSIAILPLISHSSTTQLSGNKQAMSVRYYCENGKVTTQPTSTTAVLLPHLIPVRGMLTSTIDDTYVSLPALLILAPTDMHDMCRLITVYKQIELQVPTMFQMFAHDPKIIPAVEYIKKKHMPFILIRRITPLEEAFQKAASISITADLIVLSETSTITKQVLDIVNKWSEGIYDRQTAIAYILQLKDKIKEVAR